MSHNNHPKPPSLTEAEAATLWTVANKELHRAAARLGMDENEVVNRGIRVTELIIHYPYTMVKVAENSRKGSLPAVGVGFAKVRPNDIDIYDPAIGVSIAGFRALRDYKAYREQQPETPPLSKGTNE